MGDGGVKAATQVKLHHAYSKLLLHKKSSATYRLPPLEGTGASGHLTSGNYEASGVLNMIPAPQIMHSPMIDF